MELYGSTSFAFYLLVAFIALLVVGMSVQHVLRRLVRQPVATHDGSYPHAADTDKALTFPIVFYVFVAIGMLGSAVNLAAALIAPH